LSLGLATADTLACAAGADVINGTATPAAPKLTAAIAASRRAFARWLVWLLMFPTSHVLVRCGFSFIAVNILLAAFRQLSTTEGPLIERHRKVYASLIRPCSYSYSSSWHHGVWAGEEHPRVGR
jgi:hypothetical protein